MYIKALQSIVLRNDETGELTSIAYGTIKDIDEHDAGSLINDGLAEEVVSVSPSGTLNISANGVTDVLEYAKVNVNVPTGGGGGSSDFSTAKVTIINSNTEAQTYAHADDFPHIITTRTGETHFGTAGEDVSVQEEFTIVLYEGGCVLDLSECDETVAPIVTGDVTSDGFSFLVTGDCTITVKGTGKIV